MKTILTTVLGLMVSMPAFTFAAYGNYGDGYGMMGYGGGMGGFGFFMIAGGLIWTVVGILVAVWLWQQINKK